MAEQRDPTEQPIRTQQSRSESPEDAASNSTTDSTADSATRNAAEAPTSPPVLRLGQRSKAEWVTPAESVWWDRLTSIALVSFTLGGFFALYHGEALIRAGDLAQLR